MQLWCSSTTSTLAISNGNNDIILEHPDIKKECRYSATVKIPPCSEPWTVFVNLLRQFLKTIHENVHKDIWIATWDKDLENEEKPIKVPKDFPEGIPTKKKNYGNYFSGYINPKKDQESTIYLKI